MTPSSKTYVDVSTCFDWLRNPQNESVALSQLGLEFWRIPGWDTGLGHMSLVGAP
jgi:hypothetical protein